MLDDPRCELCGAETRWKGKEPETPASDPDYYSLECVAGCRVCFGCGKLHRADYRCNLVDLERHRMHSPRYRPKLPRLYDAKPVPDDLRCELCGGEFRSMPTEIPLPPDHYFVECVAGCWVCSTCLDLHRADYCCDLDWYRIYSPPDDDDDRPF